MTDFAALKAAVDNHLSQATYWKATSKLGKGYAVAYSSEAAALRAYVDALAAGGSPTVPSPSTEHGKGLLGIIQAGLAAPAPVPPPQPVPPPVGVLPFKGCSPGSRILSASDALSWELPEIVACFGKGSLVRLDTGNDTVLQAALDAGLQVLLVIGGTIPASTTASAHASATTAAVTKWKGKLWGVEVGGNEPNQNGQTPDGNASLVKAGYAAAKAADPNVVVCAGGCAPNDNFLPFLTAFIPAAAGSFDHLAPHLYEDANVRGQWNNWDRCFHPETMSPALTVRQVLDQNGLQHVPISSGESGGLADQIGEAKQDLYVQHAYQDFAVRRAAGEPVGFITTYCMRNDEAAPGWGLCRVDHSRRPAWYSAQQATA